MDHRNRPFDLKSYLRYTQPTTVQEQLNRLAGQALLEIGFEHEDDMSLSDAYRFPKVLAHLPIRVYVGEFDTPTHIYQKINGLAWNKKHWARRSERKKIYFLAEAYKEKVEELLEQIKLARG